MKDWNYYDTFILVAPDCPAAQATVPPEKKTGKTKARIEFELASEHPYRYTQEELLFETHVRHKGIAEAELETRGEQLKAAFFQKPQACLRSSMLPKKYGWGIHFNAEGRLALIPVESEAYRQFAEGRIDGVKLVKAMRNSRK
jgi:hypothetical protein